MAKVNHRIAREIKDCMTNLINVPSWHRLPLESDQGELSFSPWLLRWRQNHLWIQLLQQTPWDLAQKRQALVSCLGFSPVQHVRLDPQLSESDILLWANSCEATGKTLYLRIPAHKQLPQKHSPLQWWIKRGVDWLAALTILLVLSPILASLIVMMRCSDPGPIFFKQWRVGRRGRLFRVYKFRTMVVNAEKLHHQLMGHQKGLNKLKDDPRITPMGRWMRKYSLDELPQLLNVLRGEMSLVGPRPWPVYEAIKIPSHGQHRLDSLPGITGRWQVSARSTLLDLEAVNRCDLDYLSQWSLWADCKILLLTIPKVLSGFGAH
jgi:lipopolysaccharide/colanic/teichoic acid biosynthesis glycosyltransferase